MKIISYCICFMLSSRVVRIAHSDSENKSEVQLKLGVSEGSYIYSTHLKHINPW